MSGIHVTTGALLTETFPDYMECQDS